VKILLVDDDPFIHAVARRYLERDGFQVLDAPDGETALRLFEEQAPDLVLTDFYMPGMNGAELTRALHARMEERAAGLPVFLPVVVLTAGGEAGILEECLAAGAVDFLTKPFTGPELGTRIRAIAQSAAAHGELVLRQAEEREELSVLKHLLEGLVASDRASLPRDFLMATLATRRIHGDICAHQTGAPGIHFGLLCDPMGHGLVAGISEIPTVDAFRTLAANDVPLPAIMAEINRKLLDLLSGSRFSCVLLFRMNLHTGTLSVLNAGLPDVIVFRADGTQDRFASTGIPLGVRRDLGRLTVEQVQLRDGDCLFACSDGFTDLIQEDELVILFRGGGGAVGFPSLLERLLEERIQDRDLVDDVSWCLWPYREDLVRSLPFEGAPRAGAAGAESLEVSLTFRPQATAYDELAPNLAGFLARQGVPEAVTQTLAVVLSEAIMNAVEHGLLGLSSDLKDQGFEPFEDARSARLAEASLGRVDLTVRAFHLPDGGFSHLKVEVKDPGQGFDWGRYLRGGGAGSEATHGRGLTLLKTLTEELAFNACGNVVTFSLYQGHNKPFGQS